MVEIMKKLIVGFIIGLLLGMASPIFSLTRQEIYRRFGPKILEAVVMVIKDEINILRAAHGLPERTNQQLINAIESKDDSLPLYDWMNQSIGNK